MIYCDRTSSDCLLLILSAHLDKWTRGPHSEISMQNTVAAEYYESSKLAKFPFEPYWPEKKLRICVTGAGGFIASHLAKRLKSEGHYIVAVDWKRNEHMPVRCCAEHGLHSYWVKHRSHVSDVDGSSLTGPKPPQEEMFCDEFQLVDLRLFENCKKVVEGCEHVFNLAADMGGMGFIQSNHSVILFNNTMISYGMLEAARQAGVKRYAAYLFSCLAASSSTSFNLRSSKSRFSRFFYASSACIYPEYKQLDTEVEGGGLKEEDAWPAQVQSFGRYPTAAALLPTHFPNSRKTRTAWRSWPARSFPSTTTRILAWNAESHVSTTSTAPTARGRVAAKRHRLLFAARFSPPSKSLRCGVMASKPEVLPLLTTVLKGSSASPKAIFVNPSTWAAARW